MDRPRTRLGLASSRYKRLGREIGIGFQQYRETLGAAANGRGDACCQRGLTHCHRARSTSRFGRIRAKYFFEAGQLVGKMDSILMGIERDDAGYDGATESARGNRQIGAYCRMSMANHAPW